ncbi:MAG TPA: hypothetical protein VKH45_00270 [Candidatus Acidoferrum sp.]|nr:hypothetical protein [Candidatus Acidoferrum sp.]
MHSENLIVSFRGMEFPVGKFKSQKEFFDPALGKRTASQTATKAASLAFMRQKTLRTRSLQRRSLIRRMRGEQGNEKTPEPMSGSEVTHWEIFEWCQVRINNTGRRYVRK